MSYKGRCPICSNSLSLVDGFVVCSNDDYKVLAAPYEVKWEEFEKDMETLTAKLLRELQEMNIKQ